MKELDLNMDIFFENKNQNKNPKVKKATFILLILTFIVFNVFLCAFININKKIEKIENDYFIVAELKKDMVDVELQKIEEDILKTEGVKRVRYISKEEAFNKLQSQLDVAIPKSENSLSDTLTVYYDKMMNLENIQGQIESNKSVKECFVDNGYITIKEEEQRFYKAISVGTIVIGVFPTIIMIFYLFHTAVTIDFMNYTRTIIDIKESQRKAKTVNILPFLSASIIGTLIFLNVYLLFREEIFLTNSRYVVAGIKEIGMLHLIVILAINILIWIIPTRIKLIKSDEN